MCIRYIYICTMDMFYIICTYIYTYMNVYIYICIYIYIVVCIYIYVYIYILHTCTVQSDDHVTVAQEKEPYRSAYRSAYSLAAQIYFETRTSIVPPWRFAEIPIWRFPEMGVPAVLIHFIDGFSLINHPAIGVPPFSEKKHFIQFPFQVSKKPT